MKFTFTSLALCLTIILQPAQADKKDDCKEILDIAHEIHPQLFPGKPKTNFIGPWCFRCYVSEICAGSYLSDDGAYRNNGVFAVGGGFGDSPYYVGQSSDVLAALRSQRPDNSKQNEICDAKGLSADISYRTEGDTTYVSTNGQCIELPEGRGICDTPSEKDDNKAIETNVHLLTRTTNFNVEISGIDNPGFDISSLVQEASNHCIIHAPFGTKDHTVRTDICIDVTKLITGPLGGISLPGFNPPITYSLEGTSTLTRVDNCFDTDARSISELVTGDAWKKENGNFVKVN